MRPTPARARAIARQHLAGYLKLPNYTNSWREDGFGDADFADGGSDRLVDALIAWGNADAIAPASARTTRRAPTTSASSR